MDNFRKLFANVRGLGRNSSQTMGLEDLVNHSVDLIEEGQPDHAVVSLHRAIEMKPDCIEAWSNLSLAYLRLQDAKNAAEAAIKAVSIDPSHAASWHNLGEAHALNGNGAKSLECNNRALIFEPSRAVFWLGRGEALMLLERFIEAAACFDRALELDPHINGARTNRDISLFRAHPEKWNLLLRAVGIAAEYADGKLTTPLPGKIIKLIFRDPAFEKDMIRSFDSFAQANIMMGKPLAIHLCLVNSILADALGDPELKNLCQRRYVEAKKILGNR